MDVYKHKLEAHFGRVYWDVGGDDLSWIQCCISLGWHGDLERAKEVANKLRRYSKNVQRD